MTSASKCSADCKATAAFSLEKFATTLRADFRFAPMNVLLLVSIFIVGLVIATGFCFAQLVPSGFTFKKV